MIELLLGSHKHKALDEIIYFANFLHSIGLKAKLVEFQMPKNAVSRPGI